MFCHAIRSLADRLTQNHAALALPEPLPPNAQPILGSKVAGPRSAVVAIVGAGASYEAAGLPLGSLAARALREALNVPLDLLEPELDRLALQYRLERNEFETQLLALSRFKRPELLSELAQMFSVKFLPALPFEMLAHLLKHRFLDCIVNFNFDELLDQAIEDELGPGNYYKVISDGDVPSLASILTPVCQTEVRFRMPMYIKPHGTASHASTMRFTREAYFLLPDGIRELLMHTLTSTPTITLILMGFAMRSAEFTALLEKSAEKGHRFQIFSIDIGDHRKYIKAELPEGSVERVCWMPVKKQRSIEAVINDVWKAITDRFPRRASRLYREVHRHRLICLLFSEKCESIDYLKDRLLVELVLAVAKAKGFVNLGQLSLSRAGRYFEYYLAEFLGQGMRPPATLEELCLELGLSKLAYSTDTFRLYTRTGGETEDDLIVNIEAWSQMRGILVEAVIRRLSRRCARWKAEMLREELAKTLDRMYEGDEVEICNPKRSSYFVLFRDPEPIDTLAAMKRYTQTVLSQDWDRLLCVAESGEWLARSVAAGDLNGKSGVINLIVADVTFREEIERGLRRAGIGIHVRWLPWWLHNQHMTLGYRGERALGGLYFERRQRSLTINPAKLTTLTDLDRAREMFCLYWARARRLEEDREGVFLRPGEIRQAEEDLGFGRRGREGRGRSMSAWWGVACGAIGMGLMKYFILGGAKDRGSRGTGSARSG